jgi:hypothetical protein
MKAQVCLIALVSIAPLWADAVVQATWNACGSGASTVKGATWVAFEVEADCSFGPYVYGYATAGGMTASAYSHADGPITSLHVTAEASDVFTVDPAQPGWYTLSFELVGAIYRDSGSGVVSFSLTGEGLDDEWRQGGEGHYLPIDTIFVSSPVRLGPHPFELTTDVRADAEGFPRDWGVGSANLRADFLGANRVVPEPSSFVLLASGVLGILLVNLCRSRFMVNQRRFFALRKMLVEP